MVAIPTAAALKLKLPFFASVDDGVVSSYIADAGRSVDDSWLAGDQANAVIFLAAHYMFVLGAASVTGAPPGGAGGSGAVQSKSVGDASESYAVNSFLKGGGANEDDLRSTVYGRQYLRLLRLNVPAVDIV